MTDVPLEVVKRGVESTEAYIDDLNTSREIVLRRKICLVGPSCAGKTSFVKSIASEMPQLVHLDDRTIGIDHFPLQFLQKRTGTDDKTKTHDVTFWDFAGQDAYQVAHSLFFSRRTLFLVCVDLEAFTIAYMQAVIFYDKAFQETKLLNEYVEHSVMRWIRMIVARQPGAEIVFIATIVDALAENHATSQLLKDHLKAKLAEVETIVHKMKRQRTNKKGPAMDGSIFSVKTVPGVNLKEPSVLFVSCTSLASTEAARTMMEELVITSNYSFEMPDNYSRVLKEILQIRDVAKAQGDFTRIARVFAPLDTLPDELKIEPEQCRIILQTLHDLGDVLWFKDLNVELFQNTVILDPLLLIDFIRQIFNHKNTGQIMPHSDLKALPNWEALSDAKQMEAMKQVLQEFHLVYSFRDDRVMACDSDLIVPALCQIKTPASWKFGGDILRINKTWTHDGEKVRAHWEYHFDYGLPLPLFDHVVVARVSTSAKFDAGPDWILYKDKEVAACRMMVGRDAESLHQTILVEAVVAATASIEQVEELWWTFEQLCGAFVKILGENPGLRVPSFAWDDAKDKVNLKSLVWSRLKPSSRKWMPPIKTCERAGLISADGA